MRQIAASQVCVGMSHTLHSACTTVLGLLDNKSLFPTLLADGMPAL